MTIGVNPPSFLSVEVNAAGVNPIDWKIREGYIPLKLPATQWRDFSGVVADVGEDVSGFKKGLEVYGMQAY